MATVSFTSALKRFFPDLEEFDTNGRSVKEVLLEAESKYPGLSDYLLEEDGSLRKHVNIYVDQELLTDRSELSDPVDERNNILIYQALSGG